MTRRSVFLGVFLAATLARAGLPTIQPGDPSPSVMLAAREVQRYVYLRSGTLLPIKAGAAESADGGIALRLDPSLGAEEFRLKTDASGGRKVLQITGGSGQAVLYGAYRFAEKLGVRFYLHGDVVPDAQVPFAVPDIDERQSPLFATRGIQPFHDFAEGPDWWNTDDYLAYVAQLAKMRMNFIGLHCYPQSGNNPRAEPLIWHGLPQDLAEDGTVTFSYPAMWMTTDLPGNIWNYAPVPTREFASGAAGLFTADAFGPDVMGEAATIPKTTDAANQVFNRVARMMRTVVPAAHRAGVKVCVGTETPLLLPPALRQHLQQAGKNPDDPAVVRELYRGTFQWVQRNIAPDYYWLWTPEGWTWGGNNPQQFEATTRDIQAALDVIQQLGHPFTLGTSGWVLGPQHDRAALDAFLPKDSPMACINRQVGHEGVEPMFANITGRPKWAIPWMENDPDLTAPQPWAARMRYDAVDARRFGCTGLLGIHWRVKAMALNVAALAAAAWDQSWVPADFDASPVKPRPPGVGARGGQLASFTQPVANTEDDPVYQAVRYNLQGYTLDVPNGSYTVTMMFNEPHYTEAKKRVFGANLQGKAAFRDLDIFARAGQNKAVDLAFPGIAVTNGKLLIDFLPQVEFPCIAGLVVTGMTAAANQLASQPFSRKVNCGGPLYRDFEADTGGASAGAGRGRTMPVEDFYIDFARASFGAEIGEAAGRLFARIDGVNLPEPTGWITGPGGIKVNGAPWEQAAKTYAFVDELEAMRGKIRDAGDRERFDYWLNTYRAMRALAKVGCSRGALDRAMGEVAAATNAVEKAARADAKALPARVQLARDWESMIAFYVDAADTPGDIGTIANLEMQTRRHRRFVDGHDKALADALGRPLPAETQVSTAFAGTPRITVPTIRSVAARGEPLTIRALVLDAAAPASVALYMRGIGQGEWKQHALQPQARSIYAVTLPPLAADDTLEYYIEAKTAGGQTLRWPAAAPRINQTIVCAGAGKDSP